MRHEPACIDRIAREAAADMVVDAALRDMVERQQDRVARGDFAMFTSVAATNKAYEGYIKIFFNHLDVFQWKKEREKNILQIFWEAIVGTVTTALKNQPQDQLATKVPISGVYTNSSVDLLATTRE